MIPKAKNKLEVSWQGPFEVIEVRGHNNYRIRMADKEKTFHIKILKIYNQREVPAEEKEEQLPEKGLL